MATTDKLPAAPVVEKGYVNPFPGWLGGIGQLDLFEEVPDMLWPVSVRTLTRMGRTDPRLASILLAIGLTVRTTNWWIDPNGANEEVVKFVAANLGLPIRGNPDEAKQPTTRMRGRFSWSRHLQQSLKYLQYGHQVFERVYTIDAGGRAQLTRLAPRPSSTIAYWDVAGNGDLMSIQQWPVGMAAAAGGAQGFAFSGQRLIGSMPMGKPIPANRLVVYVREPDPGVWFGNSILRPCYGPWQIKNELIRIEAAAARRHGIGVPKVNVSAAESQDATRMALYGQIARDWTSGASAGVAFPDGTDAHIMGPEGNMPAGMIRQAIDAHDKAMTLAALMNFMNHDKGGSYALATVQEDPWITSVQAVANEIRDTAQAAIVEDIVDQNWGIDESVPLIGCDQIGKEATAAMLQMLATARLLTPDDPLEAYIRATTGLPPSDPSSADPALEPPVGVPPVENTSSGVRVKGHTRRPPRVQTQPKQSHEQEPLF